MAGVQTLTSLAGTEYSPVDNGGAVLSQATTQTIGNLWSKAAQTDQSYSTSAATSGTTATLAATRTFTAFTFTQTCAAFTVNLPSASISDGMIQKFSIDHDVTALTVSGNGGTISNAPSTASTQSAGAVFGWIYKLSNTTWYKYA